MIIDIHSHPSLKIYLFEDSTFSVDISGEYNTSKGINFLPLQTNLPDMRKGNLRALITAHYIPEMGILRESSFINGASKVFKLFWKKLLEKIETAETGQKIFDQTLSSISIFEKHIAASGSKNANAIIAHSRSELQQFLSKGKTVFLHSVEGAHSLGRNTSGNLRTEDYLEKLDIFFDKGVCLLTLGHFYDNDLVSPTEGIPPSQRLALNKHKQKDLSGGLTQTGEEVVRQMISKGMLIDLVHSAPEARKRILEINNEYGSNKRPIIYSHSGVQALFDNDKYPGDKYYSPDDSEITEIKNCNGVIGIVFMNYWLSGRDDTIFINDTARRYILDTIQYIRKLTGSYDNIAIGTDFDAINNPADDLYNHSFIPQLCEYLSVNGIPDSAIEKITSANALRILHDGWGK